MSSHDQERRTHKGTKAIYCIVVRGEIGERFALAFEGMRVETQGGQTVLTGEGIDQSQLHGILNRISTLGLNLVSVTSSLEEQGTQVNHFSERT
jgi:outer membrane PBP1 activator LpoA protein